MRIIIRPSLTPNLHLDVTNAVIAAIASELARVQPGNDTLNWLEAERAINEMVGGGTAQVPRRSIEDSPDGLRDRPMRDEMSRFARAQPDDLFDERPPMSSTRG